MSRRAQTLRARDVTNAVKGVQRGGVKVGRVEIADGKIVVIAEQPAFAATSDDTSEKLRKLL
jgi:hypothetical protein